MSNSIRRTDILALSNLRTDGRKPHETRRMRIQMGALLSDPSVGGSALVEMGMTVALATVSGPMECQRRSDELVDRAMLQVTFQTAPFAPNTDRRVTNPNSDRRLMEASNLLKKALEASMLLHLYPRSRIQITVAILADDGGRLPAAINAATLAVLDAGIPMKDFVCACAAGGNNMDDESVLVDLNRREEGDVNLACAMLPQRGTIVLAQCEARLPNWEQMERVLEAAMEGCKAIFQFMQAAVREQALLRLSAKQGRASVTQSFVVAK
jgi:exosome complex component RRP41